MHTCIITMITDTLDQVNVTSSISGRSACPSEEVTFTCTAQGNVVFWGNQEFGEITVHNQSPPSRGNFQAVVVSYNKSQNCLVSSLSFRATASRNGTTVTCTIGNRRSSQSLSLYIMSSESVRHILAVDKFLMKTCYESKYHVQPWRFGAKPFPLNFIQE